MDHRRGDEVELVLAEIKDITLLHDLTLRGDRRTEELLHKLKGLCGGNDRRVRIGRKELIDARRMIRLHVLDDEIVRLAVPEDISDVLEPLIAKVGVHRIHDGDFVARNHIGIVRHPQRNDILPLKKVNLMVIHTDIGNVGPNLHFQLGLHLVRYYIINYPVCTCAVHWIIL